MKSAYSVLLLAYLLGDTACLFLKMYIFVNLNLSWDDAQMYCRTNYLDLISFESSNESYSFTYVMSKYLTGQNWIGLSKAPNALEFTHWSDGLPVSYTSWKFDEPIKNCATISRKGSWSTCDCTESMNFFCYDWYPQIILVQELKTWDEALRYCRTKYTDLISLTTETDFWVVNKSLSQQMTSVWTGLRFMDGLWFWVNKEPLESPVNLPSCPAPSFRCGALVPGTTILENRDCMEKMNFVCYYF